jgi:hypothetical protein
MSFFRDTPTPYTPSQFINSVPSGVHMGPAFRDWVIVRGVNSPKFDDPYNSDAPLSIPLTNPMIVDAPKITLLDEIGPLWADRYLLNSSKYPIVYADRISA